jgi:outer membrane immunogenic protein
VGDTMKKLFLAGIAATAFCGASAFAADMPVKVPPVAAAPYDPWTGCYIGANTGDAWAHKSTTRTAQAAPGGPLIPVDFFLGTTNVDGWAYGGQIGCDYQFNNNWVVGIRGMWDGSNMKGSNQHQFPGLGGAFSHFKIDSFGTLVGKLGILLNPTVELYGLAGVAWVHDNLRYTATGAGEFAAGNQTRTGYDVGGGISWMFARNWDLWIEYDHMGFGTRTIRLNGDNTNAGAIFDNSVKQSVDKVLVGIDYRFNTGR